MSFDREERSRPRGAVARSAGSTVGKRTLVERFYGSRPAVQKKDAADHGDVTITATPVDPVQREADQRNALADAATASLASLPGAGPVAAAAARLGAAHAPTKKPHGQFDDRELEIDESTESDPTTAATEREYSPAAAQAVKLSPTHYRMWGFAVASADPPAAFDSVLDDLSTLLYIDPGARIKITGHTSMSGTERFNEALAEERAYRLLELLVERGIKGNRIVAIGAGRAEPLVDESAGPAAMARNRRVEIELEFSPAMIMDPATLPVGNSSASLPGCADLAEMIRQNRAELSAWAFYEAEQHLGAAPSHGLANEDPQVLQPDWKQTMLGAGPQGYDQGQQRILQQRWKASPNGDLLAHMNELDREIDVYQGMIDKQECRPQTRSQVDPMPNDQVVGPDGRRVAGPKAR